MSDLRLNLRILMWHFQVKDNWKLNIKYNNYHKKLEHGMFELYEIDLFRKRMNSTNGGSSI